MQHREKFVSSIHELFQALMYAADKHKFQRRKGYDAVPYINHPIKVANLLIENGEELNHPLLIAAILHDVLEDTDATEVEIARFFGTEVAAIVVEVTDDMTQDYDERKQTQIDKARLLSDDAKKLKIADKIANMNDIAYLPLDWDDNRKLNYFKWAEKVVDGCRGVNHSLESLFDVLLKDGLQKWAKN